MATTKVPPEQEGTFVVFKFIADLGGSSGAEHLARRYFGELSDGEGSRQIYCRSLEELAQGLSALLERREVCAH